MTSAGVSYGRGQVGHAAQAEAAKAKRRKLMLAGGGVLLLVVLVVQVPRTLRMLSPAEATVAPPTEAVVVPSAPVEAAPPTTGVSPSDAASVKAIELKYTAKDPFVKRTLSGATGTVRVRPAPAGQRDPFGATAGGTTQAVPAAASVAGRRDPFTPRAVSVPDATTPPPPPIPLPVRPRGYTIILVSIPAGSGRSAAVQAAAAARARGVSGVGVLRSSDYATLRPGYLAVYSRLFETRADAERAVGRARSLGYPRAYVRPLGR